MVNAPLTFRLAILKPSKLQPYDRVDYVTMKVLQHSAVRLTIHERLLGIELLSFGTVLTGIFMFFLFEPPVDWFGAGCIALGILFVAATPAETFIFDKPSGRLTICRRRLSHQQVFHYPIADVSTVQIGSLYVLGTRFYRVSLQLTSGQQLAVTRTISTNWLQQQKIVRHIRGFLHTAASTSTVENVQDNVVWPSTNAS